MAQVRGWALLVSLALLLPFQAMARQSMRRCMLLPISDTLDGALAYKVFEELESYLKESDWCLYRPNSEILNILSNYKRNLNDHLANKDVLRVVAEKTTSGSLIRTQIAHNASSVDLTVTVIGENGEDVYFQEKTKLEKDDVASIAQAVKNWLQAYAKTIPYDGRVIGVLGDQFSVDIGRQFGLVEDAKVTIVRPIRRKSHPLLKEIVEWETERLGEGKIFHAARDQAQGRMLEYEGKKRLQLEDWLLINKGEAKTEVLPAEGSGEEEQGDFGKIGNVGLALDTSSSSVRLDTGGAARKYKGLLYGAHLKGEIWATRNYWASLEINRRFGSYKLKEGSATTQEPSTSNGYYKIKVGYKYLPLGFFYGPQVDGYVGRSHYSYGVDRSSSDGLTEVTFSGFILGARGSFPLRNTFRPFMEVEFMAFPKYEEEAQAFGDAESESSFAMQVGASYMHSMRISFDASIVHVANKAKFTSPTREASYNDTGLRLGTTFTF